MITIIIIIIIASTINMKAAASESLSAARLRAEQEFQRELRGSQGTGVVSSNWFDHV